MVWFSRFALVNLDKNQLSQKQLNLFFVLLVALWFEPKNNLSKKCVSNKISGQRHFHVKTFSDQNHLRAKKIRLKNVQEKKELESPKKM